MKQANGKGLFSGLALNVKIQFDSVGWLKV